MFEIDILCSKVRKKENGVVPIKDDLKGKSKRKLSRYRKYSRSSVCIKTRYLNLIYL